MVSYGFQLFQLQVELLLICWNKVSRYVVWNCFLSHQIGSFFGAYLGGLFHDLYGSYDYAWYLAIALSVFAAIIHLPIKEEPVLRLRTE